MSHGRVSFDVEERDTTPQQDRETIHYNGDRGRLLFSGRGRGWRRAISTQCPGDELPYRSEFLRRRERQTWLSRQCNTFPYRLLVLSSAKTVVLANEAMGRLLGIDVDYEHEDNDIAEKTLSRFETRDVKSATDILHGVNLSQLGFGLAPGRKSGICRLGRLFRDAGGRCVESSAFHNTAKYFS